MNEREVGLRRPPVRAGRSSALRTALATLVLLRVVLLGWTAWKARFVMDEMGLLAQLRYFSDLYGAFDPIKTVLASYFFNAPRLLFDSSVPLLLAARALGFGVAVGLLLGAAAVSRRLTGSWLGGLVGVAALLAFTNFAERSFRLRTDGLAALFALLALLALVGRASRAGRAWLTGLAAGAAFLCTQKSVYVAVALGLGLLLGEGFTDGAWRRGAASAVRFSAGWTGVVLAYAVFFGGLDFVSVLRSVFLSPTAVAFDAFHAYQGLTRYRIVTLQQNLALYAMAALVVGWALATWRRRGVEVRSAALATATLVPLVFLHNQPWPYIFVLPQAFLAPWIAVLFGDEIALPRRWRRVAGWCLAGALLVPLPRAFSYPTVQSNGAQMAEIARAEAQLSPADKYFDGVGMLPGRLIAGPADRWWWDRPTILQLAAEFDRGEMGALEGILRDRPKLWLANYRTAALWPRIAPRLRSSYVRVSTFMVLAGARFGPGELEVEFDCPWPGPYRLYRSDGRAIEEPLAVGEGAAAEAITLSAGRHLVRRATAELPALLLPVDLLLEGPIPEGDEPVPDLFAGVYDG